jgi:hypothetical protein
MKMKTQKPKRRSKKAGTIIYIDKDVAELIAFLIPSDFLHITDSNPGLRLVWSDGKRIAYNE